MTFSVIYTTRARRDLKQLPLGTAQNCIRTISKVKDDPFSFVKKLKGSKQSPLYSLRMGEYRAIMSIQEERLIVFILEIGHRSTIYRKY
jgi:mRNA interferase RelE/StbE